MSVVIFDFDGTITRQDTVRSYIWFFIRKGHFRCVLAFVYFALLKLKLIDHTTFKINIARVCFGKQSVAYIRELTRGWLWEKWDSLIRQDMLVILESHRLAREEVIIVSANFDCIIGEVANKVKVRKYFATTLEQGDYKYTGGIEGPVVQGLEKLRMVQKYYTSEIIAEATAYGDEKSDMFLLDAVKNGVLVR